MATTRADLLARHSDLLTAAPFSRTETDLPFSFEQVPNGVLDGAFRVEAAQQETRAYLGMAEEVTDLFTFYLARQLGKSPTAVYRELVGEMQRLRAAVIRDGATGGGDYAVVDGGSASIERVPKSDFMVGRLALPINYEVTL